jgi:hypothetical protein
MEDPVMNALLVALRRLEVKARKFDVDDFVDYKTGILVSHITAMAIGTDGFLTVTTPDGRYCQVELPPGTEEWPLFARLWVG